MKFHEALPDRSEVAGSTFDFTVSLKATRTNRKLKFGFTIWNDDNDGFRCRDATSHLAQGNDGIWQLKPLKSPFVAS